MIVSTNNFFEGISKFVTLNNESKKALLSAMSKQNFCKGSVLLTYETVCKNVYYIEKGLTRTLYLKDGKEITEKFNAENSFTCSMVSYMTKKSDDKQVELLEDSIIWVIPFTELEKLYDKYHDIERLGRYIVSLELVEMYQRLNDIQFKSALERYQRFQISNKFLLQRIPLSMIASFLGITQETLSRIRSQV